VETSILWDRARSDETFVALCLLTVTGASLCTQRLGFSDTLGAFCAGVLLAETNYRTQVVRSPKPDSIRKHHMKEDLKSTMPNEGASSTKIAQSPATVEKSKVCFKLAITQQERLKIWVFTQLHQQNTGSGRVKYHRTSNVKMHRPAGLQAVARLAAH